MTEAIGKIPASAPMWNGASFLTLQDIIKHLSVASYHYADDSGREWETANRFKMEAASLINENKLCFRAICLLHAEEKQLLDLADLMDAVLKDARK